MDEPFVDWQTGEEVGGFACAPRQEQERLLREGLVAPHIRRLAEREAEREAECERLRTQRDEKPADAQ